MQAEREISRDTWSEYFCWLSKELHDAPVSIETLAPATAPSVQARDLALLALAYDRRDDVFEVAATRGGAGLPSTLRHLVEHPEHVFIDSQVLLAPITIAVDDRDGVRTVVRIEDEPGLSGWNSGAMHRTSPQRSGICTHPDQELARL
jgi:hypothetical protein